MNNKFLAVIISLLLLLLIIVMCRNVQSPEITPTLAIPSITPMPPTATPSPVVTVSGSPPPAGETVVIPSLTSTAVSPTFTPLPIIPTRTPEPTIPPTPTDELLLIEKGVTYWDSSEYKYNNFECWQFLKRINQWPERALPIGEFMRLPGVCQ